MRRAIVHIGLNKTGSSTIQAFLEMNQAALRAQGIWHNDLPPHRGPDMTGRVGWMMLALSVNPMWLPGTQMRKVYGIHHRATLEEKLGRFLGRIEATFPPPTEPGVYITSSEHLGPIRNPEAIAKLHGYFTDRFDRVDYIAYIRDPVSWVPSAYVQSVRGGNAEEVEAFIERVGKLEYDGFAKLWQAGVGAKHFILRRTDRRVLTGGDLLTDFAAATGIDIAPLRRPRDRNEGASRARVRAQHWVNRRLGRVITRAGLAPLRKRLFEMPAPIRLQSQRKFALSQTQADRVIALNAASNERLRRDMFPDEDALFPSRPPANDARDTAQTPHASR